MSRLLHNLSDSYLLNNVTDQYFSHYLRNILMALIGANCLYIVAIVLHLIDSPDEIFLVLNIVALALLIWTLWKGWIRLTALGVLASLWFTVTVSAFVAGTVNTPAFAGYIGCLILAGVFLRWQGILIMSIMSILALSVLLAGELSGILPDKAYSGTELFALEIFITLIATAVSYALSGSLKNMNRHRLLLTEQFSRIQNDVETYQKTLQELQQAEARLHRALVGSPVIVSYHDSQLRYIWSHNMFVPEDLYMGKTDIEWLGSEMGGALLAVKQRVLDTGVPERTQWVYEQDNQKQVFDVRIERLNDPENRPIGVVVTGYDITAETKAMDQRQVLEAELRKNEERFRVALEGSPIVIFQQDQQLRVTWAFNANLPLSELKGKTDVDLLGEEEGHKIMALKQRALETGKSVHEQVSLHRSGKPARMDVKVEPLRDEDNKIIGVTGAAYDITSLWQENEQRKAAESELRRNAERFRVALSELPIVIYEYDENLKISWAFNSRYTYEELIGHNDVDLLGTEEGQPLLDIKRHVFETGVSNTSLVKFHVEGKLVYMQLKVEPRRDENGKIIGVTSASYYITDLIEQNNRLRESENRYFKLFNANPQPMYVFDRDTLGFIAVNDAAINQYGYTRGDFLNLTIKDIRPPEDIHKMESRMKEPPDYNSVEIWTHQRADGTVFDVETFVQDFDFEGRPARLVQAHDVTARRRNEETLRWASELFTTMFDSVPVAMSIYALNDGRFLTVNQRMTELTGYEFNEFLSTPITCLPLIQAHDLTRMTEILRSEHFIENWEQVWTTKDGREISVLVSGHVVDVDQQASVLGIALDITTFKQIERQRIETERINDEVIQRQEAVREREQTIAAISHNFRAPLTQITKATAYLRKTRGGITPEQIQEHFSRIDYHVHRLAAMLDNVMAIGNVQSAKVSFHPGATDLAFVIRSVFDKQKQADTRHHRFMLEMNGDFEGAYMDENLIRPIITQLLANAILYSPGGSIIRLGVARDGNDVIMTVNDQGIGIPSDQQQSVFEMFFRGSNVQRNEQMDGIGLGLAIVKSNVELHNGRVSIMSQEGRGTTVIVRLPGGFNSLPNN
ncbi:MAG: PAS domain S-box protein [Anaerolineae bacterium]|nr:PAS domain S-box protein [Anaerolineae bacterium]